MVRLIAACLDPRQPCLVMELCGTSLEALIYNRRCGEGGANAAAQSPLMPLDQVRGVGTRGCLSCSVCQQAGSSFGASQLVRSPVRTNAILRCCFCQCPRARPSCTHAQVLNVALGISSALSYMHPTITHRDLKVTSKAGGREGTCVATRELP